MTLRADIDYRGGYMSSEFIEGMARRYFGDDVVDALPRYVRGKRKGQLKGYLQWQKVTKGGWVSVYGAAGNGYVERRVGKVIRVELNIPEWGAEPTPIAKWEWGHDVDRDSVKVKTYETKAA